VTYWANEWPVSKSAKASDMAKVWKPGEWNSFRIRMEGEIPHITLWVNGELMWEVTERRMTFIAGGKGRHDWPASALVGGVFGGREAFSMAGSWKPGAAHRFRNIAIKILK